MSGFWQKARRTAQSANLLLDAGHNDGAVSRAYYAMYFAARSTLEGIDLRAAAAKKHATVIGQFARLVVVGRGFDPSLGRSLNLAFDQRLLADYEPEPFPAETAEEIIAEMERFLAALAPLNESSP